jgi:hypothetical protein
MGRSEKAIVTPFFAIYTAKVFEFLNAEKKQSESWSRKPGRYFKTYYTAVSKSVL